MPDRLTGTETTDPPCSPVARPTASSRSAAGTALRCGRICAGGRSDGELAADLLAETFAAAWLKRSGFADRCDGSAAPWLFGIARNQVSMHVRRGVLLRSARDRIGMPVRDYEAAAYDEAEDRLDGERLAPQLADALGELITGDRLALELRVVDSTDARPS